MSDIFFGFQTLEQKMSKILKPILGNEKTTKKELLVINNLLTNWDKIVGEKYAQICYPKTISIAGKYLNAKKNGSAENSKLTIATHNSSMAFFLESNSELILERISSLYGYKLIQKIIIKQEPQIDKKSQSLQRKQIVLSKDQKDELAKKIPIIEDAGLASILKEIGEQILIQKNNHNN